MPPIVGRVRIYDTTLRDGDQMPGVELGPEDKVVIGQALDSLGVDYIEAGFPASSTIDYTVVKRLAETTSTRIAALARCTRRDIEAAVDAGAHLVHVFIATSDTHLKYKLRMTRREVLEKAAWAVEYARSFGVDVLFSAEDATRTEKPYLVKVYRAVVSAGARYINIPDTAGAATPWGMAGLVKTVRSALPSWVSIDVHCHNDFGLATANTLAGIYAGADGAQVTVNGFGERAGNAPLEEVVAAIHFLMGGETGVKLEKLTPTARMVAERFGIQLPPNKPIVGDNAFAHEAGIHVHGVLNNPATYEPIPPESVGNRRRIVLGRHSGRHAVAWTLERLGIPARQDLVEHILSRIKEAAPRIKKIDESTVARWALEYLSGAGADEAYSAHTG